MKRKIWLPLLTAGALVATVTPILTSCRPGLMGTHDMLNPNYLHHVLPSSERSIIGKDVLINEYLKEVSENTDIIKDDILYTYSKVLTNDTMKSKLPIEFTRYFLYVDDIKVDLENKNINFILWSEVTGKTKSAYPYKYDNKLLSDFTLIIGAQISAPLSITDVKKETVDPFKDNIKIVLQMPSLSESISRTRIIGTMALAENESSTPKYTAIDVDETAKTSTNSQNIHLFEYLVYCIPFFGLETDVWSNYQFEFESYYYKNIKYTA